MPTAHRIKRGLAIVPENRRLFGPMTVLENLEMGAYLRPKADLKEELAIGNVFFFFWFFLLTTYCWHSCRSPDRSAAHRPQLARRRPGHGVLGTKLSSVPCWASFSRFTGVPSCSCDTMPWVADCPGTGCRRHPAPAPGPRPGAQRRQLLHEVGHVDGDDAGPPTASPGVVAGWQVAVTDGDVERRGVAPHVEPTLVAHLLEPGEGQAAARRDHQHSRVSVPGMVGVVGLDEEVEPAPLRRRGAHRAGRSAWRVADPCRSGSLTKRSMSSTEMVSSNISRSRLSLPWVNPVRGSSTCSAANPFIFSVKPRPAFAPAATASGPAAVDAVAPGSASTAGPQ